MNSHLSGASLLNSLSVLAAMHACWAIALIAALGYVSLLLLRIGTTPALALAIWLPGAFLLGAGPLALASIAGVVALAAVLHAAMPGSPSGQLQPPPLQTLVWPGWILLVGIQWLTLVDFAGRGPIVPGGMSSMPAEYGARYYGLWQLHAMLYASIVMCAVSACRDALLQLWIRVCTRLEASAHGWCGWLRLLALAGSLALLLGWIGFYKRQQYLGISGLHGLGKPQLSGELLKLMACCTLSWFAYRIGEWPTSPGRVWLAAKGVICVLIVSAGGLILSDDKGPMLVLALAVPLLFGIPLLGRTRSVLSKAVLCVVLAVACVAVWNLILMEVIPLFSRMGLLRAQMAENPYNAYSPTLALAMWLMDAVPSRPWGLGGFGLGQVPYCGARPLFALAECSLGTGAPIVMPSDLGYALLYASFGATGALLIAACLVGWSGSVLAASLPAASTTPAAKPVALLGAWMVAVPVLVCIAQVLVSAGALMGWSSLTGVTFPMGYGGIALMGTAMWVGLALGRAG
ncbi:hypothetical protein [Curvibacter sp. AEP1-3]|uniref:hypothetical protein n=1 Tax=Curvibacter sp. AEP1-3 TaxID=1844971 RepID=UPI000B3C4654|nr:hypothetical protein [Curvibacter sp. AEP1-3]